MAYHSLGNMVMRLLNLIIVPEKLRNLGKIPIVIFAEVPHSVRVGLANCVQLQSRLCYHGQSFIPLAETMIKKTVSMAGGVIDSAFHSARLVANTGLIAVQRLPRSPGALSPPVIILLLDD